MRYADYDRLTQPHVAHMARRELSAPRAAGDNTQYHSTEGKSMKVQDLMAKDVASCFPNSTLNDAARLMWEHDCGFVPVLESAQNSRLIGVITDRDVCMAAYTRGSSLTQLRVADAMSRVVRTCKPSDSIARAEQLLAEAQVRRLPVVDEAQNLLGVLSIADIARAAFLDRARSRPAVKEAEVGALLASVSQRRQLGAGAEG